MLTASWLEKLGTRPALKTLINTMENAMSTIPQNTPHWDNPDLAHVSGFRTGTDNLAYTISADEIRGTIPEGLHGIFLRNGPARNELAGKPFGHWFDGDGCVHTFRIENGQVDYR